jgi:homocysteine S-methyltransferase
MLETVIQSTSFILGQGSMYERLRRSRDIELDPQIFHAGLVYGDQNRQVLADTLREYLDIGQTYGLPMIATTPTWRANSERISRSGHADAKVNQDCARFVVDLRDSYGAQAHPTLIGGTTGPKGDGYLPQEAPLRDDAMKFHRPQIDTLAESGIDFLIAKTLPAFDEALGIAQCMADTDMPYVLSFVILPAGTLLDGTPIEEAVDRIDNEIKRPPATYFVNCVHASVFASGMEMVARKKPETAARITGLDANTSAKSPEELDGLTEIDTEAPQDFGENLWALNAQLGTVYLGGCCGSSTEHIAALAQKAVADPRIKARQ